MSLAEKLRVPRELESQVCLSGGDASADDRTTINVVDDIVSAAVARRASDVHLEPFGSGGRVRERVDGLLRESRMLSSHLLPRILSRVKLLAGMDIADRRLPQDGRYTIAGASGCVDVRVSSLPTIDGERLALRLLDAGQEVPSLEDLGMPAALAARYRRCIHAPAGFVVVCGPTGSGKTTTLYASMRERNVSDQQLCSIEDPVEIRVRGIAQVQVNVRAGLTFAAGLRAFLRQDPNVIMVGEMRDGETAAVAASAALCGQLVFTTLHSNDALRALMRLMELGLSARGVGSAVTAIVSQRLVRRLCAGCKREAAGSGAFEAAGCDACEGTGYRGRCGLFEMLEMTPEVRRAVETGAPPSVLREAASRAGYEPLQCHADRLIAAGACSRIEAKRVLGSAAA